MDMADQLTVGGFRTPKHPRTLSLVRVEIALLSYVTTLQGKTLPQVDLPGLLPDGRVRRDVRVDGSGRAIGRAVGCEGGCS